MNKLFALTRTASLAAAVFLVACGTEVPVAPSPMSGAPAFDLAGEVDTTTIDTVVIWPSYEVYRGSSGGSLAGASMSLMSASTQPIVRVGVLDSANSVPLSPTSGKVYLGGTGAWTMTDRSNGVVLMTGNANSVQVTLEDVPETNFRLQVMCSSTAAVNAKKAAAEALGHVTITETIPACTRLYIGKFAWNAPWGTRNTYRNLLISQGISGTDSFWKVVTFGSAIYRVHTGSASFDNANPVMVTADDGHVTIGTSPTSRRAYRGTAFARMNSSGRVAGINELPMEQYLYGVVPRELGPIAFPEVEAQKAQAVAARTYAMVGLNKRNSDGYDLRSTTSDQVYGGYQDEHPVSTAAIDATAGVVARYNGAMISTLYSSASGGHTSNNEEVYSSAPVPYLRGVPDAQRGEAFAHVPSLEVFRAHANPTSLRNEAENLFESDWSSRERWTFDWTAAEISDVVSQYAGIPVGRVLDVKVVARGPSGRALEIEYVTEAGTFTDRKDHIRTSLKYFTASGARTSLPSTLIFIEPVKERGTLTGGFRVYGGGFGHGVGMSQTGAVGMAQKGRTYDAILMHYYQGITLDAAY